MDKKIITFMIVLASITTAYMYKGRTEQQRKSDMGHGANMNEINPSYLKLWEREASHIPWFKPYEKTLTWNEPFAHWFVGGELNASYACLDKHLKSKNGAATAIKWSSENGDHRNLTYQELYDEVNRFAYVLKNLGTKKGDVVIIYMPMIPEAIAAMLACARIGAPHSVVFSGFSSNALKDRIEDTKANIVLTADYCLRRGKKLNLKATVDEAISTLSYVRHVVVVQRGKHTTPPGPKDILYHDVRPKEAVYVEPVAVESNDPLFILYTSGTTGKPKGIVHSTGGYLVYVNSTFKLAFNPDQNSTYWCTADIGWITGHSYVVYAPLMNGVNVVIYEGAPDYPDSGVWWKIIQDYKVTIFYTSPTALRMAIAAGDQWPEKYDLSNLRLLGTVGEPINPEVWKWYASTIGKSRCPVIDTWWQTETGGFMISPTALQSLELLKPGSATKPLPGIEADIVDKNGLQVPPNTKGFLVIKQPWPGMSIGIYNDPDRFKEVYWSKYPGIYYTGDYAVKDSDRYYWFLGRADEVLNLSGHRVGTAEVESAAITHEAVAEAAAVGIPEPIRGETVVIFVTLKHGVTQDEDLSKEIISRVRSHIGSFVTPQNVYYVKKLPKTRSGKIMRRVLKGIIEGKSLGDVSTLEDEASIEEIKTHYHQLQMEIGTLTSLS